MTAQTWVEAGTVVVGAGGVGGLLVRMGRLIQVIDDLRRVVERMTTGQADHEKRITTLEARR